MDDCYRGVRWADGTTRVFCPDGSDLAGVPCEGFSWGDLTTESAALAQALLYHRLGCQDRVMQISKPFLRATIVHAGNSWLMYVRGMDKCIRTLEAEAATEIVTEAVPD